MSLPTKISVVRTWINATSYANATENICRWTQEKRNSFICAANVHMVMEAWDTPDFSKIVNSADMVTPDGMPLVWMLRLKGVKGQQRVYGPTLMLHVLEMAAKENIPVGFYGGETNVLEILMKRMQAKYPDLNVVYAFSPPFQELDLDEDLEVVTRIKESGAKILFVGLGCPKQECWMAEHRDQVRVVMVGVGAAFDFHAGTKSQAPGWMQKASLEWLYRFFQEPRRLWKRYLYHNPRFVFLAILDLLGLIR